MARGRYFHVRQLLLLRWHLPLNLASRGHSWHPRQSPLLLGLGRALRREQHLRRVVVLVKIPVHANDCRLPSSGPRVRRPGFENNHRRQNMITDLHRLRAVILPEHVVRRGVFVRICQVAATPSKQHGHSNCQKFPHPSSLILRRQLGCEGTSNYCYCSWKMAGSLTVLIGPTLCFANLFKGLSLPPAGSDAVFRNAVSQCPSKLKTFDSLAAQLQFRPFGLISPSMHSGTAPP